MSCALFRHECHMHVRIVYTWMLCVYSYCLHMKSCTWLLCLNNARHSCVNNMNPWNNRFHMDLEQTHEAYKFGWIFFSLSNKGLLLTSVTTTVGPCVNMFSWFFLPKLCFWNLTIFFWTKSTKYFTSFIPWVYKWLTKL